MPARMYIEDTIDKLGHFVRRGFLWIFSRNVEDMVIDMGEAYVLAVRRLDPIRPGEILARRQGPVPGRFFAGRRVVVVNDPEVVGDIRPDALPAHVQRLRDIRRNRIHAEFIERMHYIQQAYPGILEGQIAGNPARQARLRAGNELEMKEQEPINRSPFKAFTEAEIDLIEKSNVVSEAEKKECECPVHYTIMRYPVLSLDDHIIYDRQAAIDLIKQNTRGIGNKYLNIQNLHPVKLIFDKIQDLLNRAKAEQRAEEEPKSSRPQNKI